MGFVGQRGAAFIATLILARFLSKEDFGVVGVALAIVTIVELFRDGGVANAIVTYQGDEKRLATTAFWILIATGGLFCGSVILSAPLFERAFDYPRLAIILQAMAGAQLLDTFRIVPNALMGRRHMFRERAICETIAVTVATAVAVGSLFILPKDQQIWSLAFMWIVRYVVATIAFNAVVPVIPMLAFDRDIAKKLTKTGAGMLMSNIPSGSTEWLCTIIIGVRTSPVVAGLYRVGTSLSLPAALIGTSATTALFPILAMNRDDPAKFVERSLRSIKIVNIISLAFVGWFIVVASDLIPLLLGERWNPAVGAAQWLAVAALLKTYAFMCSTPLLASERNSYAAITWWSAFLMMLIVLPWVPFADGDATRPASMTALVMGTGAIVGFIMLSMGLGFNIVRVLTALVPGYVIAGAAAAGSFVVARLCGDMEMALRLALATVAFGLLFFPLCGKIIGNGWLSLLRVSGWKSMLRSQDEKNVQTPVNVKETERREE